MPDEIFLSTQIQSRIDDIEEAEANAGRNRVLQRFIHTSSALPEMKVMRHVEERTRRKPRKPRKSKPSVTEQMIIKLSGKPQKVRQMRFNTEPPVSQLEEYSAVYTEHEWRRLKYSFKTGEGESRDMSSVDEEVEGWYSAQAPPSDIKGADWNELYKSDVLKHHEIEEACDHGDCAPAVSLSQCLPALSREVAPDVIQIDSEVEDSEVEDSEVEDSEVEDSEVEDSEVEDSEGESLIDSYYKNVLFHGTLEDHNLVCNSQSRIRIIRQNPTHETPACSSSEDDDPCITLIQIQRAL